MTERPTVIVKVERLFDFPPQAVFDAWLDPSAVGRWLFHAPDGVAKKVEIDARVGGKYEIAERRADGLARHVGEYLEIDRPRKLVFTFAYIGPAFENAPTTTITVDIAPEAGRCRLTLIHEGVWDDFAEQTEQGWTMIIDALAETLAG